MNRREELDDAEGQRIAQAALTHLRLVRERVANLESTRGIAAAAATTSQRARRVLEHLVRRGLVERIPRFSSGRRGGSPVGDLWRLR